MSGLGETFHEDITLADGKIIKDFSGNMYPFVATGTRFFKDTVAGKSGLKLGVGEKIYTSTGLEYPTSTGGGSTTDPLTDNGISVDATGIHLPVGKNVYVGASLINNAPAPLDTKGVTFTTTGIHLAATQNIFKSDGTPVNNSVPLDTKGVTFQTNGVHLATGQNYYDGDGVIIGPSAPAFDTKGVVFSDTGVAIPSGKNLDVGGGRVTINNTGLFVAPERILSASGFTVTPIGTTISNIQKLTDTNGKEIKAIDLKGNQFTDNGIVLAPTKKIYNSDMTLYTVPTTPAAVTSTTESTSIVYGVASGSNPISWSLLNHLIDVTFKKYSDGWTVVTVPTQTIEWKPYGHNEVMKGELWPGFAHGITKKITVPFEYVAGGVPNVGLFKMFPGANGGIDVHLLGLDKYNEKRFPYILPWSHLGTHVANQITDINVQEFSFSYRTN